MNSQLLLHSSALFASLFVVGIAACLPLFHWQWRRLIRTSLWTKIVWWVPIFGCLLTVLWLGTAAMIVLSLIISFAALRELHKHAGQQLLPWAYGTTVCVLFWSSLLYFQHWSASQRSVLLLCVCFSSVLSDVFAYFCGNYLGRHKLPAALNSHKSWEGVGGQLLGGLIGGLLAKGVFGTPVGWEFGLIIGAASAFGDLANSYIKRQLGIKDWGQTIPGHGGVLDRFASLSVALALGLLVLL